MKPSLKPGLTHRFAFTVPAEKTIPHLYPESEDFRAMPDVFATGFMVGLLEWTCIQLLKPHLDEGEGSLGVHINVSHKAATPPGLVVTVEAECVEVRGPRVRFKLIAHDGIDEIGGGSHERFIVKWDRFTKSVANKAARAEAAGAQAGTQ